MKFSGLKSGVEVAERIAGCVDVDVIAGIGLYCKNPVAVGKNEALFGELIGVVSNKLVFIGRGEDIAVEGFTLF